MNKLFIIAAMIAAFAGVACAENTPSPSARFFVELDSIKFDKHGLAYANLIQVNGETGPMIYGEIMVVGCKQGVGKIMYMDARSQMAARAGKHNEVHPEVWEWSRDQFRTIDGVARTVCTH
jgi:hypothetical protein